MSSNNEKAEIKETQWAIDWKNPTLMVLWMVLSTGCAVGNHVFYQHLDGKPAENQDWMIRAGTALATLMKICLSTMIGIALTQRTWTTLEHQYLPLSSIDGLFAITSNPLKLFDIALLSHAKLSMLLGVFVWVAALIPIFAPGSLTVVWRSDPRTGLHPMPNLNLSVDPFADFQTEKFSLTTKLYDWSLFSREPNRDHGSPVYGGASSLMTAIVNQAMYTGAILQPSVSPCPGRLLANCTFTQSFVGPSYKCTPVAPSYPGPQPYYFARNDSTVDFCAKYPAKYTIWGDSNNNKTCTWTSAETDEWQDGNILLDYTFVPPEHRSSGSVTSYVKYAYGCEQWRTAYTATRTFTNNIQSIVYNFTYLSRIPYWPVLHYGMLNYTGAIDAWVSPPPTFDPEAYFADHGLPMPPLSDNVGYAMHQALYALIRGQIAVNVVAVPVTTTRIGGSRLVEDTVWPARDGIQKPREDFAARLEELSRNVTLSLLAVDHLVYLRGDDERGATTTLVTEFPYRLVFAYNWVALWLTYGVALLCGIVAAGVGALSFVRNGVSRDAGFLTFLVTTRGTRMDEISRGECLGGLPMSEELTDRKVMFGEVQDSRHDMGESEPVYHAGFGVEGDVSPLRRDREYA